MIGDWLDALYNRAPGYVSVVSDRDWTGRRLPTSQLAAAAGWLQREMRSANVYVGCGTLASPPATGRGGAHDVVAIPGLWSDIDIAGPHHKPPTSGRPHPPDIEAAHQLIGDLGRPASVVIHSGHGFQAWWLFDQPWILEDGDERQAACALASRFGATLVELGRQRGWHVDDVGDLARVLRPPGSVNRKGDPVLVQIVEQNSARYLPSDLEEILVAAPAPARPQRTQQRRSSTFETPIDAFNRIMPWGKILEPVGWRYTHTVGTTDHWARASKQGSKTTSATTGFGTSGADLLYVWSEDAEVRPLPPKRWLNKFQAYALLNHGGDNKAAFRAIAAAARRGAA